MVSITGYFDGKAIVLDEAVDLIPGQRLLLQIEPAQQTTSRIIQPGSAAGQIEISEHFDAPLHDMGEYRQ